MQDWEDLAKKAKPNNLPGKPALLSEHSEIDCRVIFMWSLLLMISLAYCYGMTLHRGGRVMDYNLPRRDDWSKRTLCCHLETDKKVFLQQKLHWEIWEILCLRTQTPLTSLPRRKETIEKSREKECGPSWKLLFILKLNLEYCISGLEKTELHFVPAMPK